MPFLPGYYWQLKEKKKGILGAVRFLFNFHFLYSFSLLKSCIHFLFPTQFLFGTDFGLVFVFLKSFYFLTELTVTYHPLEMFRLLDQTQPQPIIFIIQKFDAWLANGQYYKLGSSFSNDSVQKVSHNNGLWSDTWFWPAIRRCWRRCLSVILIFLTSGTF